MDLARNLIGRINVGDTLTRTAAARPRQLAVVDGDRRFSYADFNGYVNRIAHGLAGLGYQRGSALALAAGNSAIAAMKARLDGFKVPKSVIFTDQLPKTSTGKIQKNVVRSEHAGHYARPEHEG